MFVLSLSATFLMAGRTTFKVFGLSNLLPLVTHSAPVRRRLILPSDNALELLPIPYFL